MESIPTVDLDADGELQTVQIDISIWKGLNERKRTLIRVPYSQNYKTVISDKITCVGKVNSFL